MPPEFLQKSDAEFCGAVCVEIAVLRPFALPRQATASGGSQQEHEMITKTDRMAPPFRKK
jgi:hypothetical protein